MRPTHIDHAELLRLYADPSIPVIKVAERVGCAAVTVRHVARINGVYVCRSQVPQDTRERIAELYLNDVPLDEIRELTGVGIATVNRVRRELGLAQREKKRAVTKADVMRFVSLVRSGLTQAEAARRMNRACPSLRLACARLSVEIPGRRRNQAAEQEEDRYFSLPDYERRARLMRLD